MLSLITSTTAVSPIEAENLILERKNLINVCKLVIKDLIDTSLFPDKQSLEFESNELKQFFIVLENMFNHGLKSRKGFPLATFKKDLNSVLDIISSKCSGQGDTIKSVKDMSEIKTSLGKLRAWLKLSMIQKKLADQFAILIAQKNYLSEIYDNEALLMSDEATVIAGLLVGLNVIDCNLCLKMSNDDYDQPLHTVNYSLYLRERVPTIVENDENDNYNSKENDENTLSKILDQNSYLEEVNKRSKTVIEQLQLKIQLLEKSNTEANNELAKAKNEIIDLSNEIDKIKQEKEQIEIDYQKRLNSTVQDITLERETFQTSKTGLDDMCIDLQNKLQNEIKGRLDVEKTLETQTSMHKELEAAKKLMELSLVEKQDLITRLKEQIEQLKSMSFRTSETLNKTEAELRNKVIDLDKVNKQLNELNKNFNELKTKYDKINSEKNSYEQNLLRLSQELSTTDRIKQDLTSELNTEKSLRKSLEDSIEHEKHKFEVISNENSTLKEIKKEYERLRIEHAKLKAKVEEQEKTLEEMGLQLERSRLKMEDFREVTKQIQDFEWEKDNEVKLCKLCTKEFNVARRKHHCRRCGGIYCNECSDNKLSLPSSSKPVRVCDTCHTIALQQSVATK